jgi:hypothetical protein
MSKPLPHVSFYILLALARGDLYAYAFGGRIFNDEIPLEILRMLEQAR